MFLLNTAMQQSSHNCLVETSEILFHCGRIYTIDTDGLNKGYNMDSLPTLVALIVTLLGRWICEEDVSCFTFDKTLLSSDLK